MAEKNRKIIWVMLALFAIVTLVVWFKPSDQYSTSERRPLEQFPEVSAEQILNGTFMQEFEKYVADQFPFRDELRNLKAIFSTNVLGQKDQHNIYVAQGHAAKMEYPLKEASVQRAIQRFQYLSEKYFQGTDVKAYYSVIPDKNYFLAEENGYLDMDYEKLFVMMDEGLSSMEKIDLLPYLSLDHYYATDLHWKQETLLDVANVILRSMGQKKDVSYDLNTLEIPFYGVYAGQSSFSLEPDTIYYYSNEVLEQAKVYDYENQREVAIYDMDKAKGEDPYELFLAGPLSMISIENEQADTDQELILFRDSFGSSIAPLFVEHYRKITLVDIRYIHPDLLGKYIEFTDQDVLFLYSTSILNNGETLK